MYYVRWNQLFWTITNQNITICQLNYYTIRNLRHLGLCEWLGEFSYVYRKLRGTAGKFESAFYIGFFCVQSSVYCPSVPPLCKKTSGQVRQTSALPNRSFSKCQQQKSLKKIPLWMDLQRLQPCVYEKTIEKSVRGTIPHRLLQILSRWVKLVSMSFMTQQKNFKRHWRRFKKVKHFKPMKKKPSKFSLLF